ncbi:MAG: SpoIID/LytB domain-containing protein [Bdellovibrionales bacterium]|nr:SpoIID/LytB domain-containing protein [Bdellovibrionales bacterium]
MPVRVLTLWILALSCWMASAAQQSVEVRVRLRKAQRFIDVSGFALRISGPTHAMNIAIPPTGLGKAKIVRQGKGQWLVRWDGQSAPQKIEADQLWIKGQMLRLGVEPVPYALELHENSKQGLDVIARLDLESYLMGVLPAEMPASWPLHALKAQAVAARSFVLRSAFERRDQHFDVDSTIIDQVYKFLADSEAHPEYKTKVLRAVRETRGEVLVDADRRTIKAFYSADCGCQTEDPKYVWGVVDVYTSVKDPSCKQRRPMTWKVTLPRAEVRSRLLAALALPDNSSLRALHIGGRTPSGRVADVVASVVSGDNLHRVTLNSQEFRRIFGFNRVRSTDFSLRWLGDELEVNGTGVGHGVGMCQSGARSLAEEGMRYREILKIYYPKATLWTLKRT